jgi:segregation and condensation protein A
VEVEMFELVDAFRRILANISEERFHEVGTDSISIADRINEILDRLAGDQALSFEDLFTGDEVGREYLVVTFLAVLELCKLKMVKVMQAERYGSIWIVPVLLGDAAEEGEESDGTVQS